MSQENVELAYNVRDAWNANDWEALAACYDPNVVGIGPKDWPDSAETHGWEQARRQFERLKDSWEVEKAEIDEVRAVREDMVLARFRWITSGRASGISTEVPMSFLSTVREGRIERFQFFLDHAEAVRTAGLSE
jgi:ketosteroid isomerase-like protein